MLETNGTASAHNTFDLLDDPARGLHAVLTRFGIASRSDAEALVSALVEWASAACASSQHVTVREGRAKAAAQIRAMLPQHFWTPPFPLDKSIKEAEANRESVARAIEAGGQS